MAKYGLCYKQREVLVDKSHHSVRESNSWRSWSTVSIFRHIYFCHERTTVTSENTIFVRFYFDACYLILVVWSGNWGRDTKSLQQQQLFIHSSNCESEGKMKEVIPSVLVCLLPKINNLIYNVMLKLYKSEADQTTVLMHDFTNHCARPNISELFIRPD